jgi:monoamine oxidase
VKSNRVSFKTSRSAGVINMGLIKSVDLHNTAGSYFAPATVSGELVHISGQPGSADDGSVPSDYESQIHLSILRLRRILIAARASTSDIAKLTVFVVDYDAAARKHTLHLKRFLGKHRPAVTLVPVNQLAVPSWLFEIDAVLSTPAPIHIPRTITTPRQSVDVVIIGAGLAGLSAAHDVMGKGYTCVVLEARDRVGGKTWSKPLGEGKGIVDLGAAWINDTSQTKMYDLAKRFNADLIEQNTEGDCVFQGFDGQCSPFAYGELPNVSHRHHKLFSGTMTKESTVRRGNSRASCRHSRHGRKGLSGAGRMAAQREAS